jgi:hypothetical protein
MRCLNATTVVKAATRLMWPEIQRFISSHKLLSPDPCMHKNGVGKGKQNSHEKIRGGPSLETISVSPRMSCAIRMSSSQ